MYIGSKVQILEKVDSTNEYLKSNTDIYPDGTIIVAKVQSHGKGRFSRKWISDIKGNLYCSILVKDTTWLKSITHLPIFLAVILRRAVVTAIGNDDPILGFKWPNDLVANDAKLAGILIESGKDFFIIGLGLNIKKAPALASGRKTTSLYELFPLYKELELVDFVNLLKGCYNSGVKEYIASGFDVFRKEWESNCAHLNKRVDLNEGLDNNTPKQTVLFKKLNDDGGAVVESEPGKERVIYYGELS
jgi:BirA family transcriptional regulator, biotin operon repressor / biotin---[acetyl-CoA-carboxylase] ligase